MRPELLAVIARVAVIVARPQHREACAKAERQRRADTAARLDVLGK
jgi:hypothetical protein